MIDTPFTRLLWPRHALTYCLTWALRAWPCCTNQHSNTSAAASPSPILHPRRLSLSIRPSPAPTPCQATSQWHFDVDPRGQRRFARPASQSVAQPHPRHGCLDVPNALQRTEALHCASIDVDRFEVTRSMGRTSTLAGRGLSTGASKCVPRSENAGITLKKNTVHNDCLPPNP